MKLTVYVKPGQQPTFRPAPIGRDWMDQFPGIYRCLPLNIGNRYGWEVLTPVGFTAQWNGGSKPLDVQIVPDGHGCEAVAHFGNGVLTFHMPGVVQTEPGYDLMVAGPSNSPKDAIYPLTGVIETDWSPFGFTMNWKFTRDFMPVRFEAGEPICRFYPVKRHELQQFEPIIRPFSDNPALEREHDAWSEKRAGTLARNHKGEDAWDKNYFKGQTVTDDKKFDDHQTKLKLKEFYDSRNPV